MSFELSERKDVLCVRGEMTIYDAAGLKERLFAAVRSRAGDAKLDLSKVTEFDTAGLQILLMAERVAIACGTRMQVLNPSDAVRSTLDLCRLTRLIEARSKARAQ